MRPDWDRTQVVLNPQGIAVIREKGANRAVVMPVDAVYPALAEGAIRDVQSWLALPSVRLHMIMINGSWFDPRKKQAKTNETYDTGVCQPNMTDDTGGRSEEALRAVDPLGCAANITYDPAPRPAERRRVADVAGDRITTTYDPEPPPTT